MTSKDILTKICEYANKQCKLHNVDADFVNDFTLHYSFGEWSYAIANNGIYAQRKNGGFISIGVNVPWHLDAIDHHMYDIKIFKASLSDKSYDIILKYMLHGCYMHLIARNANNIEKKIKNRNTKYIADAKALIATKHTNPNYKAEALEVSTKYKIDHKMLFDTAYPTIELVPSHITSVEQLQIWLDLNDNEA